MDELTRPQASERLADRLRNWVSSRRRPELDDADRPLLLVGVTALGSAALTLGLVLGWQAWHRGPPASIDDQLPFIVESGPLDSTAAEPGNAASGSGVVSVAADHADAVDPGGRGTTATSAVQVPSEPAIGGDQVLSEPALIIVHVSGDVLRPGVVELASDLRLHDAVALAGGVLVSADLDRVNLASPLVDGERIHIPAVGEDPPEVVTGLNGGAAMRSSDSVTTTVTPDRFNLNTASLVDLDTLPGIGPTTAQAIVATRDARGPFLSVDELVEVDGIGPTRLEALRPHLYVQGR